MRRVLILRPEPGASATAARARSAGLEAIVRPLFEIAPRRWTAPNPAGFDAVLMTSANAGRMAREGLAAFTGLPLYAVGARTAAAARAIGFADIRTGDGDGQAALDRMERDGIARALHPGGADRMPLAARTIMITAVIVYASETIEPPPLLDAALERGAVILLHSARAARRLASMIRERGDIAVAAISAVVLDAAGGGWRAAAIAAHPCDEALLAAAARLCQQ